MYTEESKRKTGVKMNSSDSGRDSSTRIDKHTHYEMPEEFLASSSLRLQFAMRRVAFFSLSGIKNLTLFSSPFSWLQPKPLQKRAAITIERSFCCYIKEVYSLALIVYQGARAKR
jgi:hypothetical protein